MTIDVESSAKIKVKYIKFTGMINGGMGLVKIRVKIDLPHPLVCRKRRLNIGWSFG
jgi:hypothetical protein